MEQIEFNKMRSLLQEIIFLLEAHPNLDGGKVGALGKIGIGICDYLTCLAWSKSKNPPKRWDMTSVVFSSDGKDCLPSDLSNAITNLNQNFRLIKKGSVIVKGGTK